MVQKSWVPSGAVNTQLLDSPRPAELSNVINSGSALTYETVSGLNRGNNVGIHVVENVAANSASMTMNNTSAAFGSIRYYARFRAWPSVNTDIGGLRTATSNIMRFNLSTTGVLTVQNPGGTPLGGYSQQLQLTTPYRFSLQASPGTTTSNGYGAAQLYNDDGGLISQMAASSSLNLGTVAGVVFGRMGKCGAAGTFDADFTLLALDTSSTNPGIIGGVAKNVTIIASAGADITVEAGQPFTLTGTETGGAATTRTWLLNGTQVGTGVSYSTTAPLTLDGGSRTYTYSVSDGTNTSTDTVVVNYLPASRRVKSGGVIVPSYRRSYTP